MRNTITGGVFLNAVIQGRNITVQLPPEITPALAGLPAPTPTFTGRQADLQSLLDVLAPRGREEETVTVAAVAGLPGVGKTELVLQAASVARERGWFPGGVLFVDLFGYDPRRRIASDRALDGLLRALGVPAEHIPSQQHDRTRLYASVLAAFAEQGRRILVVVDNASSAEEARPLLPIDGITAAVVTSRHTLGGLNARLLDLRILAADAAVDLLKRALNVAHGPADTRVRDHLDDARTIAELCGHLPLALQIVAALLADDPARPLQAMADDLADACTRLDELEREDQAVRAAFDLSYRHLPAAHARLFRLLTLNPGPETSTQTAAAIAAQPQRSIRRALEALARAHMIERGSAYGRWRMHDLIRLYADEQGSASAEPDDRSAALDRLLDHYLTTAQAADSHLRSEAHSLVSPLFTSRHEALSWLDTERPNLVAIVSAMHGSQRWRGAWALAGCLAEYFELQHHVNDLIYTQELALDAAKHLGPSERCGAASNLGNAFRIAHRFDDAITCLEQAARLASNSGLRKVEGDVQHNLGLAYFRKSLYYKAERCHRRDVKICQEARDLYGTAQALVALGDALRMRKHFREAATSLLKAISLFQKIGVVEHAMTARITLALICLDWRPSTTPAYTIWQLCMALKAARELGHRHAEALSYMNLTAAYLNRCAVCHHRSAILWSEKASELFHELQDSHSEALALKNLGSAHAVVGNTAEAQQYWRRALAIFNGLGEDKQSRDLETKLTKLPEKTKRTSADCPHSEEIVKLTAWADDLPHAVLRGDTDQLHKVLFAEPTAVSDFLFLSRPH